MSLYFAPGEIFTGTAGYYAARPGYPDVLLEHLGGLAGRVPGARVLDLGTGTGVVGRALAARGLDVVAVDPCAEMLQEGRRLAAEDGLASIEWREGTAEALPSSPGPIEGIGLAVIADAFHWMDRGRVLRGLHRIVEPGGCVAVLSHRWPGYPKPSWTPVLERIRRRHLGPARHAGPTGESSRPQPGDHEVVFRDSAFAHLTRIIADYVIDVDVEDLIAWQLSQAHSSVPVLGGAREAYETDLRTMFHAWAPDQRFRETSQAHLLIGHRDAPPNPPATPA